MADDLRVLRIILQRELETINAYEDLASQLVDPVLRQIVTHITDEEREHVAEMYELILERDVKQKERTGRGEHLAALGAAAAEAQKVAPLSVGRPADPKPAPGQDQPAQPQRVDPNPPPAPIFGQLAWSVGALKQRTAREK